MLEVDIGDEEAEVVVFSAATTVVVLEAVHMVAVDSVVVEIMVVLHFQVERLLSTEERWQMLQLITASLSTGQANESCFVSAFNWKSAIPFH